MESYGANQRLSHMTERLPSLPSVRAVKEISAAAFISLTDSRGGVDEIQGGGGQRKQEYKPKE